jgi:hypothetical protein
VSNFDPIPRLQQIAAIIEDGGHFDSPATAAHYINCAIKEIERLRMERDEARREVCKRVESASCLSDGEPTTTASDYARWCGWDCFKEDGK